MTDQINEELPVEIEAAAEAELDTGAGVFSTEQLDEAPSKVTRDLGELYTDEEELEHHERRFHDFTGSRLPWLVDDFNGVTNSVYEAVMVAANRARQVGRRQKQEIDTWNKAQEPTPELMQAEETAEKGIDRFGHSKPTIQALGELKDGDYEYYYLEGRKN